MGRPRGTIFKVSLSLVLSALVALALAEVALHLQPRLIPVWYRERFLAHGIEFFQPGVLAKTPIEELPIPMIFDGLDGPPPRDMAKMGMLPAEVDVDRERFPRMRIPLDELSFPNPRTLEKADVLMVGDSFLVAAAVQEPPGLAREFAERTGKSVYCLGFSGTGPYREAWLLETFGYERQPELVLWLYFGGNDLLDARMMRSRIENGRLTHADAREYQKPPALLLPALVSAALEPEQRPAVEPLPGLRLPRPDGGTHPIWFLPRYLFMLTLPPERLGEHRGWEPTHAILRRQHDLAQERGARFAVVFLPSKAQVYLPHVEPDPALVLRMLHFDDRAHDEPPEETAQETVARMIENRGTLERLLGAFCEENGIPFFSATPFLEALAREGELGYLTSDTHWDPRGQRAILEPLIEFSNELLGR